MISQNQYPSLKITPEPQRGGKWCVYVTLNFKGMDISFANSEILLK